MDVFSAGNYMCRSCHRLVPKVTFYHILGCHSCCLAEWQISVVPQRCNLDREHVHLRMAATTSSTVGSSTDVSLSVAAAVSASSSSVDGVATGWFRAVSKCSRQRSRVSLSEVKGVPSTLSVVEPTDSISPAIGQTHPAYL